MIYQQSLNAINNNTSQMEATALQLSSGNAVNVPSDNPIAASQAVMIDQTEALASQYSAANTSATNSLSLESSVLSQITTVIQNAQTLIVQAGDGTLSDSDRQSLATSLQSDQSQLLSLANTQDSNGNYIFGGYNTSTAPFTAATDENSNATYNYTGGTQAISQQVNSNTSMTIGNIGSDVFDTLQAGYTPEPAGTDGTVPASQANVFSTIADALAALNTPQDDADSTTTTAYTAALATASRGLSNSLNTVLAVQSQAGTKLDQLQSDASISSDRSIMYQTQVTDLTGTDWDSAISSYSMEQAALQASYSTFSSMSKLSLFAMNS
jgi:flagellar hook-associated protein 3 FlgL